MTRTGETVSVPIGSTLTRCGMSEPVMKICLLFHFLVMFGTLLDLGVGKYRTGKHARR